MLFLLLMILTGMLIKAVIILGAWVSTKIEQQLALEKAEETPSYRLKIIHSETIKDSIFKRLSLTQKLAPAIKLRAPD